jgi:hypothetical protein
MFSYRYEIIKKIVFIIYMYVILYHLGLRLIFVYKTSTQSILGGTTCDRTILCFVGLIGSIATYKVRRAAVVVVANARFSFQLKEKQALLHQLHTYSISMRVELTPVKSMFWTVQR